MPFTLAHPAAVLPIRRVLPWARFSALAIGSMSPDFVYFIPTPISGRLTHSLAGIFLFCVPASLLAYLLFHAWLKRPLAALLPQAIYLRLNLAGRPWLPASASAWSALLAALAMGASTHVIWDAFTHANSALVQHSSWLSAVLGRQDGFQISVYKLLQHLSSVAGLAVLGLALRQWLHATPALQADNAMSLSQRLLVLLALALAGLCGALVAANSSRAKSLERLSFDMVVAGMSWTGAALLLFCLGWQVCAYRRTGKAG